MLLTSTSLQICTIAAAVLATLAVLLLWNRVRGPRPVRAFSRVALLCGGYVTTAVAVLVSVNIAYGGLIVSVSDLFSNVNPPQGTHFGHPGQHMGKHAGQDPAADFGDSWDGGPGSTLAVPTSGPTSSSTGTAMQMHQGTTP